MILILMGVSGCGKTETGKLLASRLGWPFVDGDDFHPPVNVEKMTRGVPLSDSDRAPWLDLLRDEIGTRLRGGEDTVIACSALRESYRERLGGRKDGVRFVYLKGAPGLLRKRLERRRGHFFRPGLLASQLETLEEPEGALTVDITDDPETIVDSICSFFSIETG